MSAIFKKIIFPIIFVGCFISTTVALTEPVLHTKLTDFELNGYQGIVTENEITVFVPPGTDVRNMVAKFKTTGNWVSVGNIYPANIQISGRDHHDFTHPVIYIVHAVNDANHPNAYNSSNSNVGIYVVKVEESELAMDENTAQLSDLYDMTLTDDPNSTVEQLKSNGVNSKIGGVTSTYIRCYYVEKSSYYKDIGTDNLNYNFVWARDINNPSSYYKISGYWHGSGMLALKQVFFTNTDLSKIKNTCQNTIDKKVNNNSSRYRALVQVAANNALSFNHIIWQNDTDADNLKDINKIIAFGDSLSDTLNMRNNTIWRLPSSSWMAGRFSNGETWNEYLAQDLNVPVYTFAIGGAAADSKYFGFIPGLRQQVDAWVGYSGAAKNYQPSRSLVTILIGANDFLLYKRDPSSVIGDINYAVDKLYHKGIRKIVIFNLPDLTKAPIFKHKSEVESAVVTDKITIFNQELGDKVAGFKSSYPGINIELFDAKTVVDNLLNDRLNYKFKNKTGPCLDIKESAGSLLYLSKKKRASDCSDPDQFVFWDNMHITTKAHKVLEEEFLKFLTKIQSSVLYTNIIINTGDDLQFNGFHITLKSDGTFGSYVGNIGDTRYPIWQVNYKDRGRYTRFVRFNSTTFMSGDKGLTGYDGSRTLWVSQYTNSAARLEIRSDGNMYIYDNNNKIIWSTKDFRVLAGDDQLCSPFTGCPW